MLGTSMGDSDSLEFLLIDVDFSKALHADPRPEPLMSTASEIPHSTIIGIRNSPTVN